MHWEMKKRREEDVFGLGLCVLFLTFSTGRYAKQVVIDFQMLFEDTVELYCNELCKTSLVIVFSYCVLI